MLLYLLIIVSTNTFASSNCNFDSTTGTIDCNVPDFSKYSIKSLISTYSYIDTQLITYTVAGQVPCSGSISSSIMNDCQSFSVQAGVGTSCTSPSNSNFNDLKKNSLSYCDGDDNTSICTGVNVPCPPRETATDVCCLLIQCDNVVSDCILNANVVFAIGKSITANSQEVPVGTKKLTIQGDGFSSNPNDTPISCYNTDKQNIPCTVTSSGSRQLELSFSPPLNYPGAVYALLSLSTDIAAGAVNSAVQIAIVRSKNIRDYTQYVPYILVAIFLGFLVWMSKPSSKVTAPSIQPVIQYY